MNASSYGGAFVVSATLRVMRSLLGLVRNRAPVPYVGRYSDVSMPRKLEAGVQTQMDAMSSVGTLFAIVDRTSESVAQTIWHLCRKAEETTTRSDEREPEYVLRHAALSVWDQANPFMSGEELRHICQQWFELCGEFIIVPSYGPNGPTKASKKLGPIELWPVSPTRMYPIPHRTKFIAGWIYESPDGEKVPLENDQVIQVKRPNPSDVFRGLSPVITLLTDIGATKAAAEWSRNFFVNSALPGGIIEFERRLGDTEWEEFTTRWRDQHKGVHNAHRVATIEGGGKWVGRAFSMRDMQFTELRNVPRELIREAFAFPKPMLGTVEEVNRANAEAGEHMFTKWIVDPRLQRWRGVANKRLLPLYGDPGKNVTFDYESPTIVDADAEDRERASKATAAAAYRAAGWHPDDILTTLDLPPMRYIGPPKPQDGNADPDAGQREGEQPGTPRSNGHNDRVPAVAKYPPISV
jgi:HK97 family phage portal protein